MGTLTIRFEGICVHFEPSDENPWLNVPHRVVLVNASRLTGPIDGKVIPPHFASLQWPGGIVPLNGCTLRVHNPSPGSVGLTDFSLVPNLTTLMSTEEETDLGPASPPMVIGANPDLAACYFDVFSGTLTAEVNILQTVSTVLTVSTEDDEPKIELLPFATAPFPPPEVSLISFPSGSTVVVKNVAIEETPGTSEFHFYLSYLTAQKMPLNPALPPDIPQTAGPGCSNSNYP